MRNIIYYFKSVIRKIIKDNKLLYNIYTNIRYRKHAKIRNWVLSNQKFIIDNNLSCFVMCGEKSYIKINNDVDFLYVPELFGGVLGLEKKGGFEEIEIKYVIETMKAGSVIVDVGANFGFYSVLLAKRIKNSFVYSFEPVPSTYKILSENVFHNNLNTSIVINNCALGDSIGKTLITTNKYSGNHIIFNNKYFDDIIEVPVTTLDNYVLENNIDRIDFIKCDIEGAELFFLKGALNTIKRDLPDIFIEISEVWTSRFGYGADDVVKFLKNLGYSYEIFSSDRKVIKNSHNIMHDIKIGTNFYFSKESGAS